jgi:two-component system sensor histidine kinase ResE
MLKKLADGWREFLSVSAMPEMRAFWLLLPFLALLSIVSSYYSASPWNFISAASAIVVASIVFLTSYSVSSLNRQVKIEQGELKNIIQSLTDAIVGYDSNFKVLYFNPAAEKLFGLPVSEVVGKSIQPQDAVRPQLKRLVQVVFPSLAPVMIPRSAPGVYPQVLDLAFSDPPLELRCTTAPISGGISVLGFVKIIRDRTHEITLLRSKDEFITIASHQLRTPMTEITWALEGLASADGLPPDQKSIASQALTAARSLGRVTEDLLNIAKIEEGHFGYHFEQVEPVSFTEKVLESTMPLISQAGLSLYFDKPKEPVPAVTADPNKLMLAFANLLENAIRYNTKNGEIVVKVEKLADAPFVRVSVRDSGIGIASDEINKLFTKFFRGENALKYQTRGSGLGLYIAKNIIRAHGGQIGASSELNRGSTFYFTLPTDPALVPVREIPSGF